MSALLKFKLILFIIGISNISGERIKDKIYTSIDSVAACFRRHNGTHQFGCSSARGGSVGVIQLVEEISHVKWLETNATAGPYTVVMPFSMFTQNISSRLESTNNINGLLLIKTNESFPSSYSPEDTCPNRYSGSKACDDSNPWNPFGNSFLFKDWKFPIFYMENDILLKEIKDCYNKHNSHDKDKQNERPLCAMEMQSFMVAAVNSESCIRRGKTVLNLNSMRFCDPLGDRNIHWPLAPINDNLKSMILVTARLDANSMFHEVAVGANSAVTGFVTLLATAYYLKKLNPIVKETNVLFSLLNGEAFDYIGSSRFVYDLKEGNFNAIEGRNLRFNQIKAVIELSQLGGKDFYLHTNKYDTNDIVHNLQMKMSLENSTLLNSIPPVSVQSFLKENPNLTVAVITTYGTKFVNKYYGGVLDDIDTIKNSSEKNLNTTLAEKVIQLGHVLYEKISGSKPVQDNNITAIEELVSGLLSCYLESAECSLFQASSLPGAKLPDQLLPLYVGVNNNPSLAISLTGNLLSLLTGQQLQNITANECRDKQYLWMGGFNFTGVCINSTVNYTLALSPAFIIDGYDMKSGKYSTWTESIWHALSVRMFLKPSPAMEQLTIILGSVVSILSIIIVWFINSRAELLFDNGNSNAEC